MFCELHNLVIQWIAVYKKNLFNMRIAIETEIESKRKQKWQKRQKTHLEFSLHLAEYSKPITRSLNTLILVAVSK